MNVSRRTKVVLAASVLVTIVIVCLGWLHAQAEVWRRRRDVSPGSAFAEKYARLMEEEEWLTPVDEGILLSCRQQDWPWIGRPSPDASYDVLEIAEDQRSSAIERLSDVAFVELSAAEVASLVPAASEAGRRAYLVRCLGRGYGIFYKYDQGPKTLYLVADNQFMAHARNAVVLLLDGDRELERAEIWVRGFVRRVRCRHYEAVVILFAPIWAWGLPHTVATVGIAELLIACIAGAIVTFGVRPRRRLRYWLTRTLLFCLCMAILNAAVNLCLGAVWLS